MRINISIVKNTIFQISLIMIFGSTVMKAPKMRITERGGIPCPKGMSEVFCPIET